MKQIITLLLPFMLVFNLLGCGEVPKEDRGFDSTRSFTRYAPIVFAAETADTIYFMASTGEQY